MESAATEGKISDFSTPKSPENAFSGIFMSLKHSHKKKHSLEIWAVKLQFLLIYENMVKSIATARSECTTKYENKANHNTKNIWELRILDNTYYIVSDLINFPGDD